jgi:hypothetical protein
MAGIRLNGIHQAEDVDAKDGGVLLRLKRKQDVDGLVGRIAGRLGKRNIPRRRR